MTFDHQTAVSLQAVESYLLDELSSPLREEFEDHFFCCVECAEALRTGSILRQNARALLRAEPHLTAAARASFQMETQSGSKQVEVPKPGAENWWSTWFRMSSLAPTAAALLLFGVAWKQRSDFADPVESARLFRLTASARGPASKPVFASGRFLTFTLDVAGNASGNYRWILRRLQNGDSSTAFQGTGESQRGELTLILDTRRLDPGDFEIRVQSLGSEPPEEKLYHFTLKRTP